MAVQQATRLPPRVKDLRGHALGEFGRWTVLEYAGSNGNGQARWLCRCDCGTERTVLSCLLMNRKSRSCGCLKREEMSIRASQPRVAFDRTKLPEFHVWKTMIARCTNPKVEKYPSYGGRGVCVCARWREPRGRGFLNFLADVGRRPIDKRSIDRIDNNSHYSCGHCKECLANGWPANCRWATSKEQGRNTRKNRLLTIDGVTKPVIEWSEISGINQFAIHKRLKRGWTVRDAVFRPLRVTRRTAIGNCSGAKI